jgi:hypothetical protein
MSTMLFFLVPIGMLAVVWSLCFVGTCLPTTGLPNPYSDYIIQNASQNGLVAYWPLSDLIGLSNTPGELNMPGQTAGTSDIFDGHNGNYTIPTAYPAFMTAFGNSDPLASSFVKRGNSIVAGDAGSTKNPLPACVDFQGGFVNIPWSTQSPQTTPTLNDFTLEAWFSLDAAGSGFARALFGAIIPGDTAGFALLVDKNGDWLVFLGNAAGVMPISTGVSANSGYVAMTWTSANVGSPQGPLAIYNNPDSDDPSTPPAPVWPNANSPAPANLAYTGAAPSQLTQVFIGAGGTDEALRTMGGAMGAPLFPFMGQIQSVALYKMALDATTLQDHFEQGASS